MFILKRIGLMMFLGGIVFVGYEAYLWWQGGAWNPYPLSILVVKAINGIGQALENMPFTSADSIHSITNFKISGFPVFAQRFFQSIPMSAFFVVAGSFFLKWEEYFGMGITK